uniref:Putative defense protein 3 n=1 Tax=Antheraea mylitta TaxID=34739 RepID=DFP3_ANTMY|nr:RecName: Full=Putative defense protein 3; Short=DFP-3; Flags: Precursor [Antheraea mylitta]ABG72706.1 putative defense protein [Antheraea mylitta]
MMFAYIVAVVSALALTSAYPTGAPSSTCVSMRPGHLADPQPLPAPYTISTPVNTMKAGDSIEVTISGNTPDDFFRGILLQARQGDNIVGKWTVKDDFSKLLDCGEPDNAVTHANSVDKTTVSYIWTAPEDFVGDVVFLVTIVKVYETFWVAIPSAPVTVLSHK